MTINALDWMFIAAGVLQTLTAAANSMNPPRKNYGAYYFWFKFSRQMMNLADQQFESKFKITMPRVTDETATVATSSTQSQTQIESTVSRTDTHPI